MTKLSSGGSSLSYSTFIGGTDGDLGRWIAVDDCGAAYLSGETTGPDYPTTPGAFDRTHKGSDDTVVSKLNAAGRGLLYSTYLGGSGVDHGLGIAVDGSGAAYVSGDTTDSATDYPTTPGAFDRTHNGGVTDAVVTKLAPPSLLTLNASVVEGDARSRARSSRSGSV